MATIFSKIINGEIPSYKIAEDEQNYAFLDINPLAKGHTLCVPKIETDYLFDLDPDRLASLTKFAQRVAKAQKEALDCKRVGVAVLGFDVPHAHIHLVPMDSEATLNFKNERVHLSEQEFKQIAESIASKL
ncbi:MAG: HIT family protein [Bacteroidales bacterium]|nr:HIT family protein [Bacteroidales bacterium]MDY4175495.1 HIT family protein [Bacteroidales bacterium]